MICNFYQFYLNYEPYDFDLMLLWVWLPYTWYVCWLLHSRELIVNQNWKYMPKVRNWIEIYQVNLSLILILNTYCFLNLNCWDREMRLLFSRNNLMFCILYFAYYSKVRKQTHHTCWNLNPWPSYRAWGVPMLSMTCFNVMSAPHQQTHSMLQACFNPSTTHISMSNDFYFL